MSRCRTLARALRRLAPVHFALDKDDAGWRDRLEAEDFEIINLNNSLKSDYGHGCLIDGYAFDEEYAEYLRSAFGPLVVMDDHMKPPPCADLIINPGAIDNAYGSHRALTGLKHALADPIFARVVKPLRSVETVLITMGYRDEPDATSLAIQLLTQTGQKRDPPKLIVALGSKAPNLDKVKILLDNYPRSTNLHINIEDMPALFAQADLAIVSGGVTMFECLAAGCPSVVITTASNQKANVQAAKSIRAIIALGETAKIKMAPAINSIRALIDDIDMRHRMVIAGRTAVDGEGPRRIAQELMALRHDVKITHVRNSGS